MFRVSAYKMTKGLTEFYIWYFSNAPVTENSVIVTSEIAANRLTGWPKSIKDTSEQKKKTCKIT